MRSLFMLFIREAISVTDSGDPGLYPFVNFLEVDPQSLSCVGQLPGSWPSSVYTVTRRQLSILEPGVTGE